jgi:hypothetical protein
MRAYLQCLLGTAIGTLLLAVGINRLVDPYRIFVEPSILAADQPAQIAPDDRLRRTIQVVRYRWQAIILGTSRAELGLDPNHPLFAGRKCMNAATLSQPNEETGRLFAAATEHGTLEQAVLGLDFFAANAQLAYPLDLDWGNFKPERAWQLCASLDTFAKSLAALDRRGERTPPPRESFTPRAMALRSEKSYLMGGAYLPPPSYSYTFSSAQRHPIEAIRQVIAVAHARHIDLRLFISPSHARQWEVVAAAGLWTTWEDWKRQLVAINEEEARKASQAPFPLYDFSGYNSITTEPFPLLADPAPMRWYLESSHYSRRTGDLVLDRLAGRSPSGRTVPNDFGVLLTHQTIEADLAHIRAARMVWRVGHPGDVAEIEQVRREAAAWREQSRAEASGEVGTGHSQDGLPSGWAPPSP